MAEPARREWCRSSLTCVLDCPPSHQPSRMSDASSAPASIEAGPEHTLTGDIRRHDDFHSEYLEHDRSIIVYLPPGYDPEGAERYPVLYLHDGQNVFDRAT